MGELVPADLPPGDMRIAIALYGGCAVHGAECGQAGDSMEWHVPPPGADWTEHPAWPDCEAHIDSASRGEVRFGGSIEARHVPEPQAPEWPEWRRKLADAKPYAEWWRRRHHCSDAVLGSNYRED